MKFEKTYSSYSKNIYECKATKLKIEFWAFEKIYILIDEENFIVWEFKTLSQAKQGAKDYLNTQAETNNIF